MRVLTRFIAGALLSLFASAALAAPGSYPGGTQQHLRVLDLNAVLIATDSKYGTSTCSGLPCAIGTGGDDSAPLNAISAACQAAGACRIVIPPGTQLNVCANSWVLPTVSPVSVVIDGGGTAFGGVRYMPGCTTALNTVIDVPGVTFSTPVVPSGVDIHINDLRVDGYCGVPHDVIIEYGAQPQSGIRFTNSLFRNVKPSLLASSFDGGSNILISATYQLSIDQTNAYENINDPGHACYGAYAGGSMANYGLLPPYGVYMTGTDSNIGIQGVGSSIAGIASVYGGVNRFTHAHPWGLNPGNSLGQPVSQPQFDFITRGNQLFSDLLLDQPIQAGVRVQPVSGAGQVNLATSVVSAGSGGTPGSTTYMTGTTGTGTKFTALGVISPTGSLAFIPWVMIGGNYTVNPTNLSAEPVTATNGLTGVVLSINMGSAGLDSSGPTVTNSGYFGYNNAGYGFSIAPGVSALTVSGFNFGGGFACVEFDAGATMPPAWVFTQNLGCSAGVTYSVPTNSGTCAIQNHLGAHDLTNIRGAFQLTSSCTSGTVIFASIYNIMPNQQTGYSCQITDTSSASGSARQSGYTYNGFNFVVTGAAGDYFSYNCSGW